MTLIRNIENNKYLHYIYEDNHRQYIWSKEIDKENVVDANKLIDAKEKFTEAIEGKDCELVTLLDADQYKESDKEEKKRRNIIPYNPNAVRELMKDPDYARKNRELRNRTQGRTLD